MRRFTHTFPQRISAFLLCLALLVGLLPTSALAAGTDTGKAIQIGASGISGYDSTNSYDYIYYGNWEAPDENTTSGPIKWRVLDDQTNFDSDSDGTNDAGLFLLSDVLLGTGGLGGVCFDNSGSDSNVWQKSTAQTWCKNFYSNNFSSKEQNAVLETTKSDTEFTSITYGVPFAASENILNGDKVFFLSAEEAENSEYGFTDKNSRIANYGNSAGMWWLRSPSASYTFSAGLVNGFGGVDRLTVSSGLAARPAFNLDLNSVLFTSAAVGGKSSAAESEGSGTPESGDTQSGEDADGDDGGNQSGGGQGSGGQGDGGNQSGGGNQGGGGDQGGEDADAIFEIGAYTGNEWKLTLLDNSRNFAVTEETASGKPGDTITLNYTGATTGANEYISVIIADKSGAQYYGRVAQPTEASGQIQIKIPASLADGTYTLNVFSEQYNGGENDDTKLTDYASAFEAVTLTVDTTAPTLSAGSATRDSETAATVKFTSDEAGSYYYVVDNSETAPDSIDTSGEGTSCSANTEATISLDSLSNGVQYIHIVVKDAVNNVSNVLTIPIPAYTYTLTVNLNGGSGSTTGGQYPAGEVVNIDAGSRSNYRFAGWTSSNGGTFADASSESTTFTMPAADTTITANWQYNPPYIPPTYAVTVPDTTGGTVTVSPSRASSGRRVTITTQPAPGYELESLTVLDSRGSEIALTAQGDGKYTFTMPARKVTVQASFAPVPLPFEDVPPGAWYEEAVRYAYFHNIMEGMSATTFVPGKSLTRAEAVQVLYNLEGQPVVSESATFPDLVYEWYKPAIAWAESTGVVDGYEDGTFHPDQPVTRQEFAQMLYDYAAYKDYDLTAQGDLSSFPDGDSVQEWALPAMSWANGNELINGHDDGTLEPGGTTTRAQAASILMRFDQKLVEN